jgi:polar amino acid transport system permease protein
MSIELEQIRVVDDEPTTQERISDFPWWLVGIIGVLVVMAFVIATNPDFNRSFRVILPGIQLTIYTTLVGFAAALIIGLIAGLGRISQNIFIRNLATAYVEFVRGVPILVLIFTVAFVFVPALSRVLGGIDIAPSTRAIIALSLIYGAYIAEVFRAGIESIAKGQMEAARSLGMTYTQGMWYIILPQAVRNVLPALGNDFIAMLKDSSLVSVLAVRDITQLARLDSGSTFRFQENYLVLTFLYLVMTLFLSILLQFIQRRLKQDGER